MDAKFQVERDILVFAMRYALGRQTFAPTIVINNIKHNIELFSTDSIKLLIRDIKEQESFGGYGMECDKQNWMNFKNYLENAIKNRQCEGGMKK